MIATALPSRFWEKVDQTSSCWLWTAALSTPGYGQFKLDGKNVTTHRLAYEASRGPVPDGLVLDHLCRVRHCVNPDHMEPVTSGENSLRGFGVTAQNARRATCAQGHTLDGGGNGTRRYCRRCKLARGSELRRQKAAR